MQTDTQNRAGGFHKIRERIYHLVAEPSRTLSDKDWYDMLAIMAIVLSLLPLAFKRTPHFLHGTERFVTLFFAVDYLLRWICADFMSKETGIMPFLLYPLTPAALIDLCSILPGIAIMTDTLRFLATARLLQLFRLSGVFRAIRYSESVAIVIRALKRQKSALLSVTFLTISYIIVTALFIFNLEPQTFNDFSEALYWSVISVTSVGYGDIVPKTALGRLIAGISSIVAVAVIALPASIITAGFVEEHNHFRQKEAEKTDHEGGQKRFFDLFIGGDKVKDTGRGTLLPNEAPPVSAPVSEGPQYGDVDQSAEETADARE